MTPDDIIIPAEDFARAYEENRRKIEAGIAMWPSISHTWLEESNLPAWKHALWRFWWWVGERLGFVRGMVTLPTEKTDWMRDELVPRDGGES